MIDALFFIILLLAMVQGFRKGLILGIFSLVCGIIGLAAAVKFSALVAAHLKRVWQFSSRLLPVMAFVLVFLLVLLLIRLTGRILEKLLNLVLLGWLNKLGGILLFILLYLSIYSVVLFYGTKTQFISNRAMEDSHFYSMIAPLGPAVIHFVTGFIPYGRDMFAALEGFFDRIARDIH